MSSIFVRKRGNRFCIYVEYKQNRKSKQKMICSFSDKTEAYQELCKIKTAISKKNSKLYNDIINEYNENALLERIEMTISNQYDSSWYIYRFLDCDNNVLYLGRTHALRKRIRKHNHLPKECYERTKYIQMFSCENEADSCILEIYLINKYKPPYNTEYNFPEKTTLDFKIPTWENLDISSFNLWWLK